MTQFCSPKTWGNQLPGPKQLWHAQSSVPNHLNTKAAMSQANSNRAAPQTSQMVQLGSSYSLAMRSSCIGSSMGTVMGRMGYSVTYWRRTRRQDQLLHQLSVMLTGMGLEGGNL